MRLFFGLSLPSAARADTARLGAACASAICGRYVLESNYHITLAFLGHVQEDRLEDAKRVLSACASRFPTPRVTLGGVSYFHQPHNAILIRKAESTPDLSPLNGALCDALTSLGLPVSPGPFTPHVTLARHADVGGVSLGALPAGAISFAARHAHLYLSARDEENILRYTPLFSAPFSAASP